MTRNWIAANLVLLTIAGLLGWQLRVSINRFKAENDVSKLQPVQDLKKKIAQDTGGLAPLTPPKRYNPADFAIIPNQNLFSETRAKEVIETTPVVQEIPQLQVKPVLVGVTISGNQRLAAIMDPSNASTTRKTSIKRVGDTYQGYTVTDITQTQMVLEYGYRKEVIPLFDNSKHAAGGGKTAILPTRIVAFGGGGAGGTGVATPTAVAARGAQGVAPIGTAPGANTRPNQQQAKQAAAPGQAPGGTPAAPLPAGESINDKGQRVIRTPFGDIVRPN